MALSALLASPAHAKLTAHWSARAVLHGEKVLLMIADDADNGAFELSGPGMAGSGAFEARDIYTDVNPETGAVTTILPIELTPTARGAVHFAPLEIRYLQSGKTARVTVPPLHVLDMQHIQWLNDPVPCGVIWYDESEPLAMQQAEKTAYIGQPCPMGLKLLLPRDVSISSLPENTAAHSGVKTGRFRTPLRGMFDLVRRLHLPAPTAHIGGDTWQTADYQVICTPGRAGRCTLSAGLYLRPAYGGAQQLALPPRSFNAMELPSGAPAGFKGCVGHISLAATTTAKNFALHTPVEVQLDITGAMNDRQAPAPQPAVSEGWALSSHTAAPLADAAGRITGTRLRIMMYPTAQVQSIPSFVVHYFDPEQMTYNTAQSEPIERPWSANSGTAGAVPAVEAPAAGKVPVEEMKDIYGYLPENEAPVPVLPGWIWALLYLPAAGILGWLGWGRLQVFLAAAAAGREQEKELRALQQLPDDADFLKRLGSFIESRVDSTQRNCEIQGILQRRDFEAFRPDAGVQLGADERHRMLQQVRRALGKSAAVVLFCLLLLLSPYHAMASGSTAGAAYNKAQYARAVSELQASLDNPQANTARVYYNLGNCHYRLNEPGKAALYYSRALLRHPGFPEAKANLAFVMRQQGAILYEANSGADKLFTLLSCNQLAVCTWCATALLALGLALQLLLRGKQRAWLHCVTGIALAASLLCAINHLYYATRKVPDMSQLPPENLAWVLTATELRSAPDHTAHSTMNQKLPAATPLHLLDKRGNWCRVETMAGTRGWVLTEDVAPLCDDGSAPRPAFLLEFR